MMLDTLFLYIFVNEKNEIGNFHGNDTKDSALIIAGEEGRMESKSVNEGVKHVSKSRQRERIEIKRKRLQTEKPGEWKNATSAAVAPKMLLISLHFSHRIIFTRSEIEFTSPASSSSCNFYHRHTTSFLPSSIFSVERKINT